MRKKYRRYNRVLFACGLLIVLSAGAFSLLVDPFRIYPEFALDSLNDFRVTDSSRVTVGEFLVDEDPEILLIGTSRTDRGFRTDFPAFDSRPVFNGALRAGSMEELFHVARVASEKSSLKEIYFFADFFSFNDKRIPLAGFQDSRFASNHNAIEFHLDKLLSFNALQRSKKVVDAWRSGEKVKRLPKRTRRATTQTLRSFVSDPRLYAEYTWGGKQLEAFKNFLTLTSEKSIRVTIVMLPIHASLLESIRYSGVWEQWKHWKRTVVEMSGEDIDVWDFQYYGPHNTSLLHKSRGKMPKNSGFIDPSHPSKKLCERVLNRVKLDEEQDESKGIFGRKLNAENIDSWLERLDRNRANWSGRHPAEIKWIRQVLDKAKWRGRRNNG